MEPQKVEHLIAWIYDRGGAVRNHVTREVFHTKGHALREISKASSTVMVVEGAQDGESIFVVESCETPTDLHTKLRCYSNTTLMLEWARQYDLDSDPSRTIMTELPKP